MFDYRCSGGHEFEALARYGEEVRCPDCGHATTRIWTSSPTVISDSIRGGVLIEHGLCHDDGTPKRYYSHSEINRAAEAKGLVNVVRHTPLPHTDKSPHTSRWI